MKKFISFGGPTSDFHNTLKRICNEAKHFDYFDEIIGLTEKDLMGDTDFWNKNKEFILKNSKGYGYWIWKPYLINKELEKMNDGDILVYADAGCKINKNGKKRFLEYIEILNNDKDDYGVISFQLDYEEYMYTKNKIFEYFNFNDEIKNSYQFLAGIQIIKKNKHSVELLKRWSETSSNYELINNNLSENECAKFRDNRNDQSIFSILVKIYGSIIINDETSFNNVNDEINYPLLAKRIKYSSERPNGVRRNIRHRLHFT